MGMYTQLTFHNDVRVENKIDENALRVSWLWGSPDCETVSCEGKIESLAFNDYLVMGDLTYDGESWGERRKHAVTCTELTYYNADGEVVWRPE